ncbi:hypothetical protein V1481_01950 [Aeromonas enteropelogenes]|uniref:PP_RS20740 family protein n=1 Tax=Aeromonas enteropelogenes TaxID=29489 RepID=UPI003134FDC4
MNNIFDDADELFDINEVTGTTAEIITTRPNDNVFKPWHKPRKQLIRDKQWKTQLSRLLHQSLKDLNTIRYFGLPGEDLLDVIYLSKMLEEKHNNKKLNIYGFINSKESKNKADVNLTRLLDQHNIDPQSQIDHMEFEAIENDTSLALARLRANGAYHVINLDFCDAVFKIKTLKSIRNLLNVQFNRQVGSPWLLYLTTRGDKDSVSADLHDQLNNHIYKSGLCHDAHFIGALEEHWITIHTYAMEQKELFNGTLPDNVVADILQACLIFWIIHFSHSGHSRVELLSVYKYRVHDGNNYPDMFSYVFKISTLDRRTNDDSGLLPADNPPPVLSDEDKKIDKCRAIRRLARSNDVDQYLRDTPDEMRKYADEMKTLLQGVGLDVSKYDNEMMI